MAGHKKHYSEADYKRSIKTMTEDLIETGYDPDVAAERAKEVARRHYRLNRR